MVRKKVSNWEICSSSTYVDFDQRLFPAPREVKRLDHSPAAIGELIVVRVGERASAALVTYATDAVTLGETL